MTGILNWLNENIGLEGTIIFAFIVLVTSMTMKSIISIFEKFIFRKDNWGKKAGELKDRVHAIQKEYHDFKNSLSKKQRASPENKARIQSLRDRLRFAKNKRKEHLLTRENQGSKFIFPILLIIISVFLFLYIKNHTNNFKIYLPMLGLT